MGITHGQLSRIERGQSPYSQKILEIASKEYGCTVQDLLTRAPDEAASVFSIWDRLDQDQREQARRLLEALHQN
jgi:transcriptional regulator with XRE-family HTH domain